MTMLASRGIAVDYSSDNASDSSFTIFSDFSVTSKRYELPSPDKKASTHVQVVPSIPDISCSSAQPPSLPTRKKSRFTKRFSPLVGRRQNGEGPAPAFGDGVHTVTDITINGIRLRPTIVFNTFWRFAAERKAVDDRKRAGLPKPWTEDSILDRYFFCNTYRVLDKVTQYIIREVIETGPQDIKEVVFRVILFDLFTRVETWELLQEKLGPLTWKTYSRQKYLQVLDGAKKKNVSLYTGAFIKPATRFEDDDNDKSNHFRHLRQLEMFMAHDFPDRLSQSLHLMELYEWIISFPGMGEFTTYQLLLNLSYTKYLNFSGFDFVVPGPGAISGLGKMFGPQLKTIRRKHPTIDIDIIHWMAKTQNEHFHRLGITFSGLGSDNRPMELADIEHTICEVDKYSRIAHPQFKGKRQHLRRTYQPSNVPPLPVVLPQAWSHPDRKVVRVRPGLPRVEPRYFIDYIAAHRPIIVGDGTEVEIQGGECGKREYLVYWMGYSPDEATWEPEKGLERDALQTLEEYKQQHQIYD